MICLSPDEVERRFVSLGLPNRFSHREKAELSTTYIVIPEGVFGFPIPEDHIGLNILNLKEVLGTDSSHPPSFFDHRWYQGEGFAAENCEPGWHFIQMEVLPESISQPVNYISRLKDQRLELAAAVEVVLMLFLHYVGVGEHLLQRKHTWCRDRAGPKHYVTVGAFGRNGVFVSAHPGEYTSRGLGTCAKLRT